MWGRSTILWFEEKSVDFLFLVNIFFNRHCFEKRWNISVSVEKFPTNRKMADIGRQGAVQFLLTLCVFFVMFVLGHCTLDLACIEVKKAYTEKGLNENEVPIQAISGKSAVMIINEIDL